MSAERAAAKLHLLTDDAEMHALYLAIGRASMMWSSIENQLAHWFVQVAHQMDHIVGREVFFSVSGFKSRETMFRAAMRKSDATEDIQDFLKSSLNKARTWSSTRNAIAHGMAIRIGQSDGSYVSAIVGGEAPTETSLANALTVKHLEHAASNFNLLAQALFEATFLEREADRALLADLRQRVRLFPNNPAIEESHDDREVRRRQLEAEDTAAALRKESAPLGS